MTEARQPGDTRLDLLIDPLDFQVLDVLPIEGTLHFGAYPVGKTAKEVQHEQTVGEGQMTIGTITSRLRFLNVMGWAVKSKGIGTGGRNVWQRTKLGEQELTKWKGGQDG